MRSLFKVIKSSQLVLAKSCEIKCPGATATERFSVLAVEEESNGPMEKVFGPEEAAAIIAETEAMVKELLEKAEAKAKEIIDAAREEAAQLIEAARKEAVKIREENSRRGYQEGRKQALKEVEVIREQKLAEAEAVLLQAQEERKRLIAAVEPEMISLAVAIAEKILHRELASHPEYVTGIVREALQQVNGQKAVIKVHERFLQPVKELWEEINPNNGNGKNWEVEVDNTVEPGGCVIETGAGYIDAQLSTQLGAIREALEQVKNSA